MKQLLIFSLLLLSTFFAWSQTPNQAAPKAPPETIAAIRPIEDSLMVILDSLAEQSSRDTLARLKYYKNDRRRELSQQLAKTLIQALKVPNSFNYPFDSIKNYITIVQPDDRSFRIFTWPLITLNYNVNNPSSSEESYQYYGAIQMNNPELKLHGLFDKSGSLASPEYETTNNDNWYGCTYYGIVTKEYNGQKFYNLFGWDGNTVRNTRKLIDVISFDEEQKPVFGAPIFAIKNEEGQIKIKNRFMLEFKKSATVNLRYDAEQDMIIYDHLAKEEVAGGAGVSDKGTSFVPDGQYFGLKFENGTWKDMGVVMRQYLNTAPVERAVLGGGRNNLNQIPSNKKQGGKTPKTKKPKRK
jgi:hypothetical protein